MAITSRSNDAFPHAVFGSWTSTACCATDQTENVGFQPSWVLVINDSGATAPKVHIKHKDESDENVGFVATMTSPADSAAITITSTGFTCDADAQTASGTNQYIAFR